MLCFYKSFFPVVWILFLLYWQVIKGAITPAKTTQRLESATSRIARAVILVVVIVLLSIPRIPIPWLFRQLWPVGLWPFWIGAGVTVCGLLFAVWARERLGGNWSNSVTIKRHHELVTTGPYALVRHPIYTGILIAFLGTAIALSEVRGFVGLVLMFTAIWKKLRIEEKWMNSNFGEFYAAYARRTAALVPYLF